MQARIPEWFTSASTQPLPTRCKCKAAAAASLNGGGPALLENPQISACSSLMQREACRGLAVPVQ